MIRSRQPRCTTLTPTRNGVYHLENLALARFAQDKIYEFAFVSAALKLKGATG